MTTEYIDVAATAKLIRAALKTKFPGVKFSVRSSRYAGGSSIAIDWTDGPAYDQVNAVTRPFSGAEFDGMIDLKFHVMTWLLPDGTTARAKSPGTVGSRGTCSPYDLPAPCEGARLVQFHADYVFCHRDLSKPARVLIAAMVAEKYGADVAECKARIDDSNFRVGAEFLSTLIHRESTALDLTGASAELAMCA